MNRRRVTVRDDNTEYVIYYPYPCHTLPPIGQDIPDEGCQTVSIDIGIKNFAIRIETRYRTGYIEPIYFNKIDFTQYNNTNESNGTTAIDPPILSVSLEFLKQLLPILKKSRIVGIERQMGINYKSSLMFQHVLTFLMLEAPSFDHPCIIMDIWSKLKSRILGAPKGLNKNGLKKWSIQKARELLTWRQDEKSLQIINHHQGRSKTKADDLADTVVQMEAWFILVGGVVTQPLQTIIINPSNITQTTDESSDNSIIIIHPTSQNK